MTGELVDETIIQQMIEDTDASVMPMLIDHYIEETQQRSLVLDQAFADKNIALIKFESHTLSSTSLALGNRELSTLARRVEALCVENKIDEVLSYHQQLIDLALRSMEALNQRKEIGFS